MEHFEYDYFGTRLYYSYTNYRTGDYPDEELDHSSTLFSKIVLAAKALHKTKDEEHQRFLFKRKLMREIVQNQTYPRTAVQAAFHFIDYLLQLPESYTKQLSEEIRPIIRKETKLMELYNKENASPTIMNTFDLEFVKGIEEGKIAERNAIALKLMEEQLPLEKVSAITGLSVEEVKEIWKTTHS